MLSHACIGVKQTRRGNHAHRAPSRLPREWPVLDGKSRPVCLGAATVAALAQNPKDKNAITSAAEKDLAANAGRTRFDSIVGNADIAGKSQKDLAKITGKDVYETAREIESTFGNMEGSGFNFAVRQEERQTWGGTASTDEIAGIGVQGEQIPIDDLPPMERSALEKKDYYSKEFAKIWQEGWSEKRTEMMAKKFNRIVALIAVMESIPKEELQKYKDNNIVKVFLDSGIDNFVTDFFTGGLVGGAAVAKMVPIPGLNIAVSQAVRKIMRGPEEAKWRDNILDVEQRIWGSRDLI